MGIREWRVFPDAMREKLLEMDFKEWGPHIQRSIPSHGRTMADSARVAFESGSINRRHYLLLAASTSSGGGD